MQLLFALFLTLLMAPNVSNAEGVNWKTVSADKLEIIFRGEALEMKLETAKKAWVSSMPGFVEYANWRGSSKMAFIVKQNADPGYTLQVGDSIDDRNQISLAFGLEKNGEIVWGKDESFSGPLGIFKIHYLELKVLNCIAWGFGYDDSSAGEPLSYSANNIFRALYCQREQIRPEFAKRVVLLSGYKGGYEPPETKSKIAAKPTMEKARDVANEDGSKTVPVATNWLGSGDLFVGFLKYRNNAGNGPLEVSMGTISCRGTWQFSSGKYGTAKLPRGSWTVACSDGRVASGTYISNKLGQGTGLGTDANGEMVKITYGVNSR